MLMNILSIIVNIAYLVVLNLAFYTDRVKMPTGEIREWHRSPVTRLSISNQSFLFYLQIVLAAVSIITSVLLFLGFQKSLINFFQFSCSLCLSRFDGKIRTACNLMKYPIKQNEDQDGDEIVAVLKC